MTERLAMPADSVSLLASTLGGGVMQARLKQKGWTDQKIGVECKRIIDEEPGEIERWCDGRLEDFTHPGWLLSIKYHTAMRILNEREGVHGDALDAISQRRDDVGVRSEPVRSHQDPWEHDDDLDDDDELADIGIDELPDDEEEL